MDALEAESQLDESFVAQQQVIDADREKTVQQGSSVGRFFQTGLDNSGSGSKNIFGDGGKNFFDNTSGGLTPATNAPNSTLTIESSNSEQKGFILRG